MRLTTRLKELANFVDKNVNVVDIGCDHALLDIYLTLYNNNSCIASDVNENALSFAKKNISKYNLDIKTVISDGFDNINIKENTTAIIAGMGTINIINILKRADFENISAIIIQSNTDLYELRKEVVNLNYKIKEEKIVFENGIFYVMIKFIKGISKYSDFEYKYGPYILKNKTDLRDEYFKYIINTNKNICEKLTDKNIDLKEELLNEIEFLKNYI